MDIWIGGEIESAVEEKFRLARCELESDLSEFIKANSYELELDSFDCIAIIRNDVEFDEIHKYSAKKKEMDFRLSIDFKSFLQANHEQCKTHIYQMLLRAIDILALNNQIKADAIQNVKSDFVKFGLGLQAI